MTQQIQEILGMQGLEWLLLSATDAMLIADQQGRIVFPNPPLLRLFGYTAEEMTGMTIEQLLPERFRHGHAGLRQKYDSQPQARAMGSGLELLAMRGDGTEFPVEVSLSPLSTQQGVRLVMATVHDISRRKQAEAALQESEARMRAVFETAVDAIITIDERGAIDRFNPAAERLFGYAEAEVVGKNISMLMPSPYREEHDGYLDRYRRTGEKRIIGIGREVLGMRKDGTVFPIDLAVAEMRFQGRRMFTGMVRDISERKQAEQALRQSQAELRHLAAHLENIKEAERKRIAQEIHDELGGLLTGIKAHLSVYLERAARHDIQPDQLVVDAAKLADSGFQSVRRVITDLRPSVLDQLGVWAALEWYAGQIANRSGLECSCEIAPETADMELAPDLSTMVFRVVQEALTNVVRHAEASRAAVRTACRDGVLVVEVEDDGKGIANARETNRDSWGIVGMHERARYFGGELTISGEPGRGTSVVLRLPLENRHAE